MNDGHSPIEGGHRKMVVECVRRALRAKPALPSFPADDEDLLKSGALDSMGWLAVLQSLQEKAGVDGILDCPEIGEPCSIAALVAVLEKGAGLEKGAVLERGAAPRKQESPQTDAFALSQPAPVAAASTAVVEIAGWGAALGCLRITAEKLDGEYNLAEGTLRERAGIESVARAGEAENELSLATQAAETALRAADIGIAEIDWLIATSETFVGFPSFGSLLHTRLLARGTCGVLDVGGACVGLLNALSVGNSLLAAGTANRVLITTAEVHSRRLTPQCVAGEFGGLFGDGASAFVMTRGDSACQAGRYRVRDFQFGCAGSVSSALAVGMRANGQVALEFRGEALARAALVRLEKIIAALELRTGFDRRTASSFATHQPNPRIIEMLARQANLPLEKFPVVSRVFGNLGSSTCGVALSLALSQHAGKPAPERGPIFLAGVGPGMLWGGGVLC